jgi:hypothetical protein
MVRKGHSKIGKYYFRAMMSGMDSFKQERSISSTCQSFCSLEIIRVDRLIPCMDYVDTPAGVFPDNGLPASCSFYVRNFPFVVRLSNALQVTCKYAGIVMYSYISLFNELLFAGKAIDYS